MELQNLTDIIIVSIDGKVTIKRISMFEGAIELISCSDDFEPIQVTPQTELRIIGKVHAAQRIVNPVLAGSVPD